MLKLPDLSPRPINTKVMDKLPQRVRDALADVGTSVLTFRATVQNVDDHVEILIFDAIGDGRYYDGVTATGVVEALASAGGKDIVVRLNSPGGLAYDGIVIYNALKDYPGKVTTRVEGLAASAAALIYFAGDEREMQEASSLMVHRALVGAVGNAAALRDTANELDKLDNAIAKIMSAASGMSEDDAMQYLIGDVDGTVFTASEALDLKLTGRMIPIRTKEGKDKESNTDDTPPTLSESEVRDKVRDSYELEVLARLRILDLDQDTHTDDN